LTLHWWFGYNPAQLARKLNAVQFSEKSPVRFNRAEQESTTQDSAKQESTTQDSAKQESAKKISV